MKNKVMVGIAIIMAISLVTLMPTLPTANATIQTLELDKDGGANGHVGPTTTITLAITYQGLTTKIDVQVQGADAYDAAAGALYGLFDISRSKFIAFSAQETIATKSWKGGWGGWDSYDIQYYSGHLPDPYVDSARCTYDKYTTVSSSTTFAFIVTYCTWWGASCSTSVDLIPIDLSATVACAVLY